MRDLKGKVAVITGGASGFGRELAICCAREGMSVVLADVDEKGLRATGDLLKPLTTHVLSLKCDVSHAEQVEELTAKTYDQFGAAHLLFNNAGIFLGGPTWTATLEDWQWALGVNLMGVVHGIRSFVPRMIEQKTECHIVNTSSAAGLISVPGTSVYSVSKHGVIVLSECLYHELHAVNAAIGVSVLCPTFVKTGIQECKRNRPAEISTANPMAGPYEKRMHKAAESGKLSAVDVARITMEGVKANRFYILTHLKIKGAIEMRLRDILDDRAPTNPMP